MAMIAGGALLIGACGPGSDTEATESEETTTSATDDQEQVYESPLGEFLGWDMGADFDADAAQAEAAEFERKAQEYIVECMRAEGFDYTPVDYSEFMTFDQADLPEEEQWGTEAWVKKYGFGITTMRYPQSQVGPDLVGYDESSFGGPGEDWVDPNEEYAQSLSDAEREAFYAALYGDPGDYPVFEFEEEGREPTEEEMAEMDAFWETFQPSGCQNEAYETLAYPGGGLGEEDEARYQAFDEEFGDAMEEMWERIEASPELIAHREQVETCVTEKGYDYLVDDEMYQYFEEKMNESGLRWIDPLEGVDTTNFTEEDFERAYREAETRTLPPDQLAILAELQAEEIGMAVATFECGGGWEGEMKIRDELRIEMERQFLEDNADRLAEYEGVFRQD
jgi:hypothetical protein